MKRILSFIISVMLGATILGVATPVNVSALECEKTFLGLRPWYMGLTAEAEDSTGESVCVVKYPGSEISSNSDDGPKFFWTIVLNISADISLVVGYAAIIFVIYGGYKYILSTGEPGKVAQAKTIITNALIGLAIALLATVIVNTIIIVVAGAAS